MQKYQVEKLGQFEGHRDCVYKLTKCSKPNLFMSSSGDGMVVEWDLNEPDKGRLIAKHSHSVYAMCFHEELDFLYTGENYTGIHLIDYKNHVETSSAKITEQAIFDITVHQHFLLVASGDGVLHVLDKLDLSVISKFKISDYSLRSLAILPSNSELAIGSSDGGVYIIRLSDFRLLYKLSAHESSVFKVCYDPEGRYLLTLGRDARLKKWSLDKGYVLEKEVIAHTYALKDLVFHPNNPTQFATSSMDKTFKIWELENLTLKKVIDRSRYGGHTNSVNSMVWLDDENNTLVTAGDDKLIMCWRVDKVYQE